MQRRKKTPRTRGKRPKPARAPAKKATGGKSSVKGRARPGAPIRRPTNPVATMVAASAQALGLALDPAWHERIEFNLGLILSFAALVDEFPLPDDAEPAPVFHA